MYRLVICLKLLNFLRNVQLLLTYASWVKRDRMNLSQLDVAHADVSDNVHLEVECKRFEDGSSQGGTCTSTEALKSKNFSEQIHRACALGQELVREDTSDTDLYLTRKINHSLPHFRNL